MVIVLKVSNGVLLIPQNKNIWENCFDNLDEFSEDFTKVLYSIDFNQDTQKRDV